MIDIKPVRDETLNCIEGIIASVANHYNVDYRLMFLTSWGFKYDNPSNKYGVGERLGWRTRKSIHPLIDALQRYHGYILKEHDSLNKNEVKLLVQKELDLGYPVVIYIDGFLCPWNMAFRNQHIPHYILIIGICEETGSYVCIDPYCTDKIEQINFNCIGDIIKTCYTCRFEHITQQELNWKHTLEENLSRLLEAREEGHSSFDKMRIFAENVKNIDIEYEKGEMNDYNFIQILMKIKFLENSRKNIVKALKCLNEIQDEIDFLHYEERILYISNLWNKLKSIILKAMIISNNKSLLDKASSIVYEILSYEETLARNLHSLVK